MKRWALGLMIGLLSLTSFGGYGQQAQAESVPATATNEQAKLTP